MKNVLQWFREGMKPKEARESSQVSKVGQSAGCEKVVRSTAFFSKKKTIFVRLLGRPTAGRLLGGWPILLKIQAIFTKISGIYYKSNITVQSCSKEVSF